MSPLTDIYIYFPGAAPMESLKVADVGDVKLNMYRVDLAIHDIQKHFSEVIKNGCKTLAMGGDHLMTYPILQAYRVRSLEGDSSLIVIIPCQMQP